MQPAQRGGTDDTVRDESVLVLEILDPDIGLVAEGAVGHEKWERRLLLRKGGVRSNLVQRVLHRGDVSPATADPKRATHRAPHLLEFFGLRICSAPGRIKHKNGRFG